MSPKRPYLFYRSNIKTTNKGGKLMRLFLMLLRESVLTQGAITFALVVTTCYLWASGQNVPNELWTADTIVLGYFFGSKAQQAIATYTQNKGG